MSYGHSKIFLLSLIIRAKFRQKYGNANCIAVCLRHTVGCERYRKVNNTHVYYCRLPQVHAHVHVILRHIIRDLDPIRIQRRHLDTLFAFHYLIAAAI